MGPTAPQHPSASDLSAFARGKLNASAAQWVIQHLDECAPCRSAADKLRADATLGTIGDTPSAQGSTTHGDDLTQPYVSVVIPAALRDSPKYRILRMIGQGGMGVVYQAEHRVMERLVAIKVISQTLVDRPEALERFHREVRAAAKLDHPNIVKAYDAEQAGDLQILAMEYVEGRTLADVVKKKGPLPIAHACNYVRQAALGLQHAFEQGMVHRDLKPQNLMLTSKGTVKILDFGLAKLASEQSRPGGELTQQNAVMGTPEYMAPEQAINTKGADIRADIYALGCTLYCLLAGRPPFAGDSALEIIVAHTQAPPAPIESLRTDTPPELATLLTQLLAKKPADRPQTPKTVADALAPLVRSARKAREADTLPMASPSATTRTPSRWRLIPMTAAAIGLIGIGLVAGGLFKTKTAGHAAVGTFNDTPGPKKPGVEELEQLSGELRRLNYDQNPTREKWRQHALDEVTAAIAAIGVGNAESEIGRHLDHVRSDLTDLTAVATTGPLNKKALAEAKLDLDAAIEARTIPKGKDRVASFEFGQWKIEGQDLVQNQPTGATNIRFGHSDWTDYDFSCEMQLVRGNGHGSVVFRAVPNSEAYFFRLGAGPLVSDSVFHGRFGQKSTILMGRESSAPTLQPERWQSLHVRVRGDQCWCYVNEQQWFHCKNLVMPKGKVGLNTFDAVCRFRNLRVTDPSGAVMWEGLPTLPAQNPNTPITDFPDSSGFVSLFNGKDLTGWEPFPGGEAKWSVENGAIVGRGGRGYLFTRRGNFTDFHIRAEAKANAGANSGIFFRMPYSIDPKNGYEAQIDAGVDPYPTGSLYGIVAAQRDLVRAGEWFTIEVLAEGRRIRIFVNDKLTVDHSESKPRSSTGFFALQQQIPGKEIRFRKIEVKELK